MTTLREPFDNVHKKDIKNKQGQVVAQVDYVGWSQSADRLDEAVPEGWSFAIMGIGPDWVHGRLTIGERWFENIGYAENADADWKKEALKDAASDAFKRCAALAGVARYLYDKDAHTNGTGRAGPSSPARPVAAPARTSTNVPEEPEFPPMEWDAGSVEARSGSDNNECPIHHVTWNGEWGDLWHKDPDGKYCRHPENTRGPAKARR